MRILLVEDKPLAAVIVQEILQAADHNVDGAATGAAALAIFHDRHPRADLLITEAVLPDMNGWEVLSACRAIVPGLPGIVLTESPLRDFRSRHYAVTLQKPFSEDALLAAVKAAAEPSA